MPRSRDGGGFSGPLSTIAVASIALGVVVMVMAVSILRGFQGEIAGKVVGFGSHLTVTNYAVNPTYQETPVTLDDALASELKGVPGVRHLQSFATKGGMVKTKEQIYGILLRGVSRDYDTLFFHENLVEGRLPDLTGDSASNDVLVSNTVANKLKLKVGDKLRTYFVAPDARPRPRAFLVCGIYNTDLPEVDELYVVGDLRQVQRLNNWEENHVGGYELLVDDFDRLEATAAAVSERLRQSYRYDLSVHTIKESYPALFAWLDLLNSNITLILIIMSVVCTVAIVSALLIMIFEKGRTIGVLKTLGASNASVRRIFILKASRLIVEGVVIGDAVAAALCYVQWRWAVVKLDAWIFVAISLSTIAVCVLALLLPAVYISHISPAKTIKSE